jgi:predicted nucleic acid-binding protein
MLIVADSSTLVALALCGGLEILDYMFENIQVPQAVYDEVIVQDRSVAQILQTYLQGKVVSVSLASVLLTGSGLGQGEIEAMVLYKSACAHYLLIDDNRARKVARLNQITVTSSLGIFLLAKYHGLIPEVRPYIERLRRTTIRISEQLIQRTLALAEE